MHTMLRKKLLHSPGLYLVLDRQFLEGMDIVSIVTRVLAAGVDMIQLRDKESTDKEFFETGRKIIFRGPLGGRGRRRQPEGAPPSRHLALRCW